MFREIYFERVVKTQPTQKTSYSSSIEEQVLKNYRLILGQKMHNSKRNNDIGTSNAGGLKVTRPSDKSADCA